MEQVDLFEQEIWVDIDGHEGCYQISNTRKVRSLDRYKGGKYTMCKIKGQPISITMASNGYPQVSLCKNGIPKMYRLHRLLAIAFIPNPENKKEVNHINGIRSDNRLSNLEWNTRSENTYHSFRIGLHIPHDCKGEKNGQAKLKEKDVIAIRELLKQGVYQKEIGKIYGVSQTIIGFINTGKSWKHIPRP